VIPLSQQEVRIEMNEIEQNVVAAVVTELLRKTAIPREKSVVVDEASEMLSDVPEGDIETVLALLCTETEREKGVYLELRNSDQSSTRHSPDPQRGVEPETGQAVSEVGNPTGEKFGQLTILEDVGHEEVPDIAEEAYYERTTVADKTDVQVATKALEEGMNIILKGPPGVGKSYLAKYICAQTNRPLYRVALSETTYREDLLGHLQLVSAPGGDSVTSWVDGPLTRAAREGGMLLLDEINAADANTAAALNAVMEQEDTRSLTIPQTGEVVTPHPEFGVIATANPGYQGTYEQNQAFEGRFRHIELDYVPTDIEVEIIFERTELDERKQDEIVELVSYADRLREAYVEGELTTPVTTRELVRIATFMENGFMNLETATRSELLARVDDHDTALVATLIEKSL
jgi:nitric oxide reductase NorQ protein